MSYDVHSGFGADAGRDRGGGSDRAPVLYYTTRPFLIALAAQSLPFLLLLPLMLAAPETFLAVALTSVAMAWWMHAAFRFELTASTLRLRLGPFSLGRTLALKDIEQAEALDPLGKPLRWGHRADSGHLRLKLTGGEEVIIVGLAEPLETADAVETLRRRAVTPPDGMR